ncbi:MAG: type III-B CRISPR-associated protein Cas10/Cmr2 [Candidatus Hydrothermales bacterium]
MSDYRLKLKALLHDPIDKQFVIWKLKKKHEEVAREYLNFLLYGETIHEEEIKLADQIASAISRIIVVPEEESLKKILDEKTKFEWEEIKFIDIFSLRSQKAGMPDNEEEVRKKFKKLGDLKFNTSDERVKVYFLFLWRFLPEIFPWINTHPADSRAPNHSIYDHLVQTSAIASSLPKPTFLLFTIAPVQEYISTSRKTSDLWSGSYILSYLIYKATTVILDELGPDNIIYPNLLKQPLVDRWLYEKFKNTQILDIFKDEEYFKKFIDNALLEENLTIANFPNRFLAIIPFEIAKDIAEKCKEKILKEFENFTNKLDKINEIKEAELKKETKEKILKHLKNYFQIYYVYLPWLNDSYTDIQTILDEYIDLVGVNERYKIIDIIKKHSYYKPTTVGTAYSLLVELVEKFLASRKMYRKYEDIGEQKGEKCHLCGNYDILPIKWDKLPRWIVRERERLCGVCFIKRVFPSILKDILNFSSEIKFPSTSEMATVLYKTKMEEGNIEEFKREFEELRKKTDIPKSVSVPALNGHMLYDVDGEWLFRENYRKERFEREIGKTLLESDYKNIIDILNKIKKPPTYYAILMMDGDEMGKWLKGDKMPKIGELMHSKVRDVLKNFDENFNEILTSKHPISASIHEGFSRRLTDFALNRVKKLIEEENYGKLVYAGGDDILALLPVEKVIKCAYELQEDFKNVLSERASMSAGVVIAHHKYPLSIALNKVREALKNAKEDYGRNAFCVIYLSKSGEERKFGGKWTIKDFFNKLICIIKEKEISKGFAYEILEVIEKISDINIVEVELKRILRRKFRKDVDIKKYVDEFTKILREYNEKLKDFGDMLIIAERIFEN